MCCLILLGCIGKANIALQGVGIPVFEQGVDLTKCAGTVSQMDLYLDQDI